MIRMMNSFIRDTVFRLCSTETEISKSIEHDKAIFLETNIRHRPKRLHSIENSSVISAQLECIGNTTQSVDKANLVIKQFFFCASF